MKACDGAFYERWPCLCLATCAPSWFPEHLFIPSLSFTSLAFSSRYIVSVTFQLLLLFAPERFLLVSLAPERSFMLPLHQKDLQCCPLLNLWCYPCTSEIYCVTCSIYQGRKYVHHKVPASRRLELVPNMTCAREICSVTPAPERSLVLPPAQYLVLPLHKRDL